MLLLTFGKSIMMYFGIGEEEERDLEEGLPPLEESLWLNQREWMFEEEKNARENLGGMRMMFDDFYQALQHRNAQYLDK
jgi:hypothetical protein